MKHPFSKALVRQTAGLICCFACLFSQADELLEELLSMSLDDLANYQVNTSTKTTLRLADAPGSISVITREQIERSTATSIPELLRNLPGVNIRWNPMVQTIDMRSFGSNPFTSRVLLLIDGVPYNSWNKGGFPQHPGFDFFNLDIVDHIEVMRGAGSSLYGENALNGVINIITMNGNEGPTGRLRYARGNLDLETLSASTTRNFGENRSLFGALRYTRGKLPTELWLEDASGAATGYDLYLKSSINRFKFSYYRRDDSFKGYAHDVSGDFPEGTFFRSAEKVQQQVNIVAAGYKQPTTAFEGEFKANLSYANRDGSHCAACHARNERPGFSDSEDHGYQLFANSQLDAVVAKQHKLSAGLEWRKISSGEHAHELHGATSTHHSGGNSEHGTAVQKYQKHALFIQDQWKTSGSRLMLTAGMRYESASSPALFPERWFPRVSGVLQANEQLTLKAGWHRAARYPSFSELYQDTGFLSAETPFGDIELARFEPNLDLQPELVESSELIANLRLGSRARSSITFFNNNIENAIVIAYPRIRFENHPANARVRGFELEFQTQPWEWLDASLNWSVQDNKQTSDGLDSSGFPLEFTYAPKHKVNMNLAAKPSESFSANLEVNWKSEVFAPSFWYPIALGDPTRVPLSSFAYVNLNLVYQPKWFTTDGSQPVRLSLALRNLTDERPYETLSGFGGRNAGRSGYLSAEYRWGGR